MKTSFYKLSATLNNGEQLDFLSLRGKKVLIVNTASKCGFTNQYADLEKLSERYKDKLVIIAFPANDFANQENGSDEEISEFCKVNYGVTFPIAKKAGVIKNEDQQLVFKWLTDKNMNGWNDQAPEWNFNKYLISENGDLLRYFESSVAPLDEQLVTLIEN
ncbi:glutathione peroxidase [Epilithonimonas tenax]|uniref:glutathione peroxidase n=1 Tax=Epilithonimonas tenax TaxID=191577 RepID=UPI0004063F8C|nr:glutathione peroxidase [Epilithonimonas tenax]